jgi:endoglycosylceramidase
MRPVDILSRTSTPPPGIAGRRNLQPLYQHLHESIREVDDHTVIMFEPVTWGILLPGQKHLSLGSGFTQVPGGDAYKNRTAMR